MSQLLKEENVLESQDKTIVVAVAGNPNAGKSTLINSISGSRLHVGNWPGVTVERKEAEFIYNGYKIKLIDLPGSYSLSPYSQEEIIARDFLTENTPDVILNVIDTTVLERNLYLTIQLLELNIPLIAALNMFDEAEQKGYKVKTESMEALLGCTVIPTVATKRKGLDDILKAIVKLSSENIEQNKKLHYSMDIDDAINQVEEKLKDKYPSLVKQVNSRWLSMKLLEGDERIILKYHLQGITEEVDKASKHLKEAHDEDLQRMMTDVRYGQAAGLAKEILTRPDIEKLEFTEQIDRLVLNKYLGIPIFFFIMWILFKLTFDIADPYIGWLEGIFDGGIAARWSNSILDFLSAPDWVVSLVNEGIIGGVGFVLVFVPVIFAMMFFITFLEASGYLARAAFIMDQAMHKIGLHGKSFIPLILGFGCNVPSIYATRILESDRDKILTSLLVPLMSCGARLPIYVLFAATFFGIYAGTVIWGMYVLGIVLAIVMGLIFKRFLFKGESPVFIMELPPYRFPTLRNLAIHTWEKGKHYMVKAGTYILGISIVIWFILNIGVENGSWKFQVADKKDSILGQMGQFVSPVFKPLGFGTWEASSSILSGVIAKEIYISTTAQIYKAEIEEDPKKEVPTFLGDLKEIGVSFLEAGWDSIVNVFSGIGISSISTDDEDQNKQNEKLRPIIKEQFSPLASLSLMVFMLLYMPCVITLIAMKQEFQTWKWPLVSVVYQTALAWIVAFIIYQGGTLLGLGV